MMARKDEELKETAKAIGYGCAAVIVSVALFCLVVGAILYGFSALLGVCWAVFRSFAG